ncbi:cytochrome-c peroxidase [Cesiribacter andamanensis]|uniref:Cytochrome c551 peroxidase n=1 Tax=Cesiribacter andamanensis AMV16 TaxID=1279009 RepID=M7N3W6_9BACT|nr:cytochrome c peroxidase [Cesiribacter andamanensis]EMR01906.1 Cytochrome c551 peroxidase precursor [Cesiribacter andamanensis AMV16]
MMHLQMIKKETYGIISLFFLILATSCSAPSPTEEVTARAFQEIEDLYRSDLTACIMALEQLQQPQDADQQQALFRRARMHFKLAEPMLAFAEQENYRFLNQPNILKIEEEDFTDIKRKAPSGFQVLEELIFDPGADAESIGRHAAQVSNRLKLIRKNTRFSSYLQYHFLWMMRNALVRVALTGITGFDSPVQENSLEESAFVYRRLKKYLSLFKGNFRNPALLEAWNQQFDSSLKALQGNFEAFDRYTFLKDHTHAQLALWVQTKDDWNVSFPFTLALEHDASSLFTSTTFNLAYFEERPSGPLTKEKVLLGKQLFHDPSLSASGALSCASCHQEARAFTDGKQRADGQLRNSPSLSYAALQRGFFYDKRTSSLEGQIISVVNNQQEFHSSLEDMVQTVRQQPAYQQAFARLYPQQEISDARIRHAIASYIRSLTPFDSRFDRSIDGLEQSLSESEIRGFNLFSGKAKCATCHFAPVFNGTVPPEFSETELELLGVPDAPDTVGARIDQDPGRYQVYGTEERKFFFKTPSLRNSAHTAPYMHNGVYNTLEEVLDFYNRGGGAGIGIALEHQTLPPDALQLSKQEIADIIAFLGSLSDRYLEQPAGLAASPQP